MTKVATTEEYLDKLLQVSRPGLDDIFSFYEHRLGVIGKDPRVLLIPMDDHLVHRGDGAFETLKFIFGRIYLLDTHIQRMKISCEKIYLQPPCSWDKLRSLVLEVTKAADKSVGLISLFVGRGPGSFGIDFRDCPEPSLYIVTRKLQQKPEEFWKTGVTAHSCSVPAKQGYLSRIKSVDYLPNVLMKREAVLKGCDYPFCFDQDKYLAEGATENVCLVNSEGALVVPEMRNALAGTTLLRALELIKKEIQIIIRPIVEKEIYEAREVMILGTSFDVVSVVRYNGKPIHDLRPGPVSKRLRELIIKDQKENGVIIE